jgi:hypothetical protein
MTDPEVKTIVGTCGEISEKSGWTAFHVNVPGSNYPYRLNTKLPAIIDKGRAVGSAVATWTFKEQVSEKINDNTGKPYTNRYLNDVEAGAHAPAAGQGPGTHDALAAGDRERSIVRQSSLKAASELYAGTGDVAGVIAAATRFEVWVYRDLDELPSSGAPAAAAGGDATPDADAHSGHADDDIPF